MTLFRLSQHRGDLFTVDGALRRGAKNENIAEAQDQVTGYEWSHLTVKLVPSEDKVEGCALTVRIMVTIFIS